MASHGGININTNTTTSPKGGKSEGGSGQTGSPKAGQCLCSPTTHQGSFRCRFHRSSGTAGSSSPWIMKRSKSMPANKNNSVASFSPKSVEST